VRYAIPFSTSKGQAALVSVKRDIMKKKLMASLFDVFPARN
jgi:hypothetical protein